MALADYHFNLSNISFYCSRLLDAVLSRSVQVLYQIAPLFAVVTLLNIILGPK